MQTPMPPSDHCPRCGWSVHAAAGPDAVCPHCALPLTGPGAAELRDIAAALAAVDAERNRLLARRAQLLAQPWAAAPPRPRDPRQRTRQGPGRATVRVTAPARETTAPAVQNVLLSLGGVLLAVAAVAFTVVSWGHLGLGGRAAVLAVLTGTAMTVPALLLRRALNATAEVVACLGLVLLLLDAYAVRRTLLPGPEPLDYWATALTVVSALWGTYATVLGPRGGSRGLVLPGPAAALLAQLPLLLWSFTAQSGYAVASALLGTAVLDGILALTGARSGPGPRIAAAGGAASGAAGTPPAPQDEAANPPGPDRTAPPVPGVAAPRMSTAQAARRTALIAGAVAGAVGLLVAGSLAAGAQDVGAAVRAGALLLGAAVCALAAAYRTGPRPAAHVLGAVAGLGAIGACAGVVRMVTPHGWAVPASLACATGVLAAGAALRRTGAGRAPGAGLAAGAAAVQALAALWALGPLAVAVFGPLRWAGSVWTGAPDGARAATAPGVDATGSAPAVVVAVGLAAVLAAAAGYRRAWAGRALGGALAFALLAAGAAPTALDLPYTAAVLLRVAVVALLLAAVPRLAGTAAASSVGPDPARKWWQPHRSAAAGPAFTSTGPAPGSAGQSSEPPGARDDDAVGPHPTREGAEPGRSADQLRAASGGRDGGAVGPAPVREAWEPGSSAHQPPAAPGAHDNAPAAHPEPGPLTAARSGPTAGAAPRDTSGRPPAGAAPPPDLVLAARAALAAALVLGATAVGWALAERTMTLTVLAVLLAAFTAAAAPRTRPELRATAATAAVACAAGLAWAGPLAAGRPAQQAAYAVLAVAAGAQLVSVRALGRPVEYAGYAAGVLAVALAARDAPSLAAVLALAGVLAAGVALRADRRPWAGYVATVLMVAAGWVRLAASGVTVPEAYALPATVAALGVGWLRRRRDPAASSWTAYAPGLAATLLPSVVAVHHDPHWLRPLLLGTGTAAVTLLGARHRLQAPLLLGGAALVLDALHELAPFVLQALGVLPRWLPLALVGVVLLAVGATYEHRLRDVRRVRDVVGRMR